jgi:hypothetical protein
MPMVYYDEKRRALYRESCCCRRLPDSYKPRGGSSWLNFSLVEWGFDCLGRGLSTTLGKVRTRLN